MTRIRRLLCAIGWHSTYRATYVTRNCRRCPVVLIDRDYC